MDDLFSRAQLLTAWLLYRRGKRRVATVATFELQREEAIERLASELSAGCYRHEPYRSFLVRDPKERTVTAASLRDRVVHQVVFSAVERAFEPHFLDCSYSARAGRGTHRAVIRAREAIACMRAQGVWPVWALKADVAKFYDSVDHAILLRLLQRRVRHPALLAVIAEILRSYHSTKGAGKGLPIGNLTSQIFANVYLHELDHYAVHTLRLPTYLRYADDVLLLGADAATLRQAAGTLRAFAADRLLLNLSAPADQYPRKLSQGVDWLGTRLWPYGQTLRRATRGRIIQKFRSREREVRSATRSAQSLGQIRASYRGIAYRVRDYPLRARLEERSVRTLASAASPPVRWYERVPPFSPHTSVRSVSEHGAEAPPSEASERRPPIEAVIQALASRPKQDPASVERLASLRRAVAPLQPLVEKYWDYYYYLEPAGADGRPLAEEFDDLLHRWTTNPAAVPRFTYPNLAGLQFGDDADVLAELRRTYEGIADPHVRAIALHALTGVEGKLALFDAMRRQDDTAVAAAQKVLFGPLAPSTVAAARASFETAAAAPLASPVLSRLRSTWFSAEEIRTFFERACRLLRLEAFSVVVSPTVSSITVKLHPEGGGAPVIAIPPGRVASGLEVLRLIAHEVGTHAVTNQAALALGLPLELGPDYETFQEGLATVNEIRAIAAVSGESVQAVTASEETPPYYVLALDRVQRGGTFRDTFETLLMLHARVWLRTNVASPKAERIRYALDAWTETVPAADLLAWARETPAVLKRVLDQCRRLYRGFHDLSGGGRAFFKDKMYFEGRHLARAMEAAGVADALLKAKIDPWLAEHLAAVGIFDADVPLLAQHIAPLILREQRRELLGDPWEHATGEFLDLRGDASDARPQAERM